MKRPPNHSLARFILLIVSMLLPKSVISLAQTAESPARSPLTFEVASVKLSHTKDARTYTGPWNTDGFTVRNASLNYLIEIAFGVQHYQIAGLPPWEDSERFDVDARTENGSKIDWKSVQVPLQALLRDRLGLQVHREQMQESGYVLVAVKPKLTPATGSLKPGYVTPEHLQCEGMPLNGLASMLAIATHRPVQNQTGIQGAYNFDIRYASMNDTNSILPDIFTAVQEQLGLKLEPGKVPVEMLVIDHVERIPTEN